MEIILPIVIFLLGIAVGSFLNVCIDRLPAGKSLVYPPSHCDACQHRLSPKDLIPVFSYIWLRGRCRYCQTSIPIRPLWVEIGSGILFAFIFWYYGLSVEFALTVFYSCVFLVILFIDLEHKLILNKVTYPVAVVTLILLAVDSIWPDWGLFSSLISVTEPRILSGVIGGAIGFSFFFVTILIYPKGMGWGDVKLAGLIGLVTGFPMVFVALFSGIFIGGVAAIIALPIKGRKFQVQYGAFLALGPIVSLMGGSEILAWYMGFL